MVDRMDVRIRDRLVRKGIVAREQVEEYLTKLPDRTDRAEWIDYDRRFAEELLAQAAQAAQAQAQEKAAQAEKAPAPIMNAAELLERAVRAEIFPSTPGLEPKPS